MSVLLDTHLWLWWGTGAPDIRPDEIKALNRLAADQALSLSAISLWEAEMLIQKGRIVPNASFEPWLRRLASPEVVRILPLDVDAIAALHRLPESFHGDPADRLIVATALAHGLPLATHDKAIRKSGVVKLWKP